VLLVPATMRLFGDANWWGPKWLRSLRRALHLGLDEGSPAEPTSGSLQPPRASAPLRS
jgi:hypothetical protein